MSSMQPWNGWTGSAVAGWLLEPIGNVLPVECEMAYYRQLEESAMAD